MQDNQATARLAVSALGLLLASGAATAQTGGKLPELTFKGFGNTEATTIEDFAGRLVMIEVFAYW